MAFNFTADLLVSDGDNTTAILLALQALSETQVLVGIPEEQTGRESDVLTNAALLYIQSNGSPLNNIPARPVIEPALENSNDKLGQLMGDAAKKALSGDQSGMNSALETAGLAGEAAVRAWFTSPDNGWAPNAESTQKAKERKGSTDPRPLIDTGELRRSITYVVRRDAG